MSTGYGTDLFCFDQIYTGRLVTGVDLLAQAAYRRLTTARGTLDDGEEGSVYGVDLTDFVGQAGGTAVVALPAIVSAELLNDERFDTVDVDASIVTDPGGLTTITLAILITPADAADAFTLTLAVSAVSVEILGVTPA